MRSKSIVLLVLALGCGLVASIGITQLMANRSSGRSDPTTQIFVALEDIPLGAVIAPEMVKSEQWPEDKVPEDAIREMKDVEKRRTKTKIWKGDAVRDSKLFPAGASGSGSMLIPSGYRVVSTNVNLESGASNMLLPGDRVDVLVSLSRNVSRGIPETTTRTVLQDVKVFAVNDVVTMDEVGGETKPSINAKTVSLLVTPNQAQLFTMADQLGEVRLSMRSPDDEMEVDVADGVSPAEILGLTEKGDRDEEKLIRDDEPETAARQPTKSTGATLLGFLGDAMKMQRQAAAMQPHPVEPGEQPWAMRVIRGSDVEMVTLSPEQVASADSRFWNMGAGLPIDTPTGLDVETASGPTLPLPGETKPSVGPRPSEKPGIVPLPPVDDDTEEQAEVD